MANDYYEIYELDLEWSNFLRTKLAIEERLESIRNYVPQIEIIDEFLRTATTNNELEDIHTYLSFQSKINPNIEEKVVTVSRNNLKKHYQKMLDAKLHVFGRDVVLSASDFAKNLKAGIIIVKPKRNQSSPSILAEPYK